jgi:hypothetical protein
MTAAMHEQGGRQVRPKQGIAHEDSAGRESGEQDQEEAHFADPIRTEGQIQDRPCRYQEHQADDRQATGAVWVGRGTQSRQVGVGAGDGEGGAIHLPDPQAMPEVGLSVLGGLSEAAERLLEDPYRQAPARGAEIVPVPRDVGQRAILERRCCCPCST